ncbi:uncharacterized protein LOC114939266 [Nylanderia fulva]|uniref:uncharacterized protein LOC114939266 n=1 Tax=Nylanderia fulva TaxID=613905 RepID=UPI0010FBB18D|nr:uncharacterized protein LOC114939266 [Nylanderia fulva]
MSSWYRRFIPQFATLSEPITRLLKKGRRWEWGDDQDRAFQEIRDHLVTAPTLACPNFEIPFVLQTDASSVGLGAVLTQTIDGEERVIAFASRALADLETRYTVTEQECLAVVWAIKKFRPYLEGYRFTVVTDHSSLRWLHNLKNPTGKLARWALELLEYDYEVIHRKGALHHVPDALSRMYEGENTDMIPYTEHTNALVNAAIETIDVENITDEWYRKRLREVIETPNKFTQWKVLDGRLYRLCTKLRLVSTDKGGSGRSGGSDGTSHCGRPVDRSRGRYRGPLPRSKAGFQYLLVIQDLFTKWVECKALRAANGSKISEALEDLVISRWGAPRFLLTDNGTEFINKVLKTFAKEHNLTHITVPPYHPQANPVERVNRILKTMIISFIDKDHREWDEHLPEFRFAYNTACHSSLGASPAFLNLGRELVPVYSLSRRTQQATEVTAEDTAKWADRMRKLQSLREWVVENLNKAYEKQASHYNLRRRDKRFRVGNLVLKRQHVLSSAAERIAAKLAHKFQGPYRIARVISPVVYELAQLDGTPAGKWHIKDLKAYHVPDTVL